MIDFAVIDLMHHMSTAPVVIDRPFAVGMGAGARKGVDGGEVFIAEIESTTAAWLQSAGVKFSTLIKEYRETPANEQRLHYIDQMIEAFEAQVSDLTRTYRRHIKMARRVVKYQKMVSARSGVVAGMQGARAMRSLAQIGDLKQEIIFALRALRSELNATASTGPIFSDPDAMTAYLRAAVA